MLKTGMIERMVGSLRNRYQQIRYYHEVRSFDKFRAVYDRLSFADHVRQANRWARQFPEQARFTLPPIQHWLAHLVPQPASILEIGGWRGDLAKRMLSDQPAIIRWHNYDLLTDPKIQKCTDPRYRLIPLVDYIWDLTLEIHYNALIATHMIEHIKWRELRKLARWIPRGVVSILLEAPLPESHEQMNWMGQHSTHILEKGWAQVKQEMIDCGFQPIYAAGDTVAFSRAEASDGFSQAGDARLC